MTDWGTVHDACVDEVAALVAGLEPADLDTVVPASPDWTVHDVIAHMAGTSSDAANNRMEGAPGEEWTSRQVTERRETSVGDLVAELRTHQVTIADLSRDAERPAIVWGDSVHLADLFEALGRGVPDPATWAPIAAVMAPRLAHLVGSIDHVSDYEVFRASFSRRSLGQLAAMFPDADPAQLSRVGIFGPREDDQPVPDAG